MQRLHLHRPTDPRPGAPRAPHGGTVCKLRLAVDDMARGRETGYINVSTFGKPGEAAAEILSTGWLVAVDGRLEYHEWQQDGKTRHDYEVIGQVEFLAAPRNTTSADAEQPVGGRRLTPSNGRDATQPRRPAHVPLHDPSPDRHEQPAHPGHGRHLPRAGHRPHHARAGRRRRHATTKARRNPSNKPDRSSPCSSAPSSRDHRGPWRQAIAGGQRIIELRAELMTGTPAISTATCRSSPAPIPPDG